MQITFDGGKLYHELNHKLSSTVVFDFNLDDVKAAIEMMEKHNFNSITIDSDVNFYDDGVLMDAMDEYDIMISHMVVEVRKSNIFFIVALDECGEDVEYSGYITHQEFQKLLVE